MILASELAPNPFPSQADIAGRITKQGGFVTPPSEIARVLNHYWQNKGWVCVAKDTATELLAEIAASLEVSGLPAVVSDGASDHWWIIDGLEIQPSDVSIWALDPDRKGNRRLPPAHTHDDDCQTPQNLAQRRSNGGTWQLFDPVMDRGRLTGKAVGIVFSPRSNRERQSSYAWFLAALNAHSYETGARVRRVRRT